MSVYKPGKNWKKYTPTTYLQHLLLENGIGGKEAGEEKCILNPSVEFDLKKKHILNL